MVQQTPTLPNSILSPSVPLFNRVLLHPPADKEMHLCLCMDCFLWVVSFIFFFPRQEEQALSGWYEAFYLSLLSKKYSQKKRVDICHKLSELSKESEGHHTTLDMTWEEKKVAVCLCNLDASLLAILYQSEKARLCCGNKHSPLCGLAQFKLTINHMAS